MINPFKPNSPVTHGMFVGRSEEMRKIESALIQTKANQSVSFLLLGERGIGKTSLLLLVKYYAEGLILVRGQKLNYLVIEIDVAKETTSIALIKKIEMALRRKLAKTEKAKTTFSEIWNFVKNIEAAGIKLNQNKNEHNELIFEEFSYSIADTLKRITKDDATIFDSRYDGILVLIDEADNSSDDLNLGTFVKTLMERLQKEGTEKLLFGIAGLPKLKDILHKSHPSSLRLFTELNLDRLSNTEIKRVIQIVLAESKEINGKETIIEQDAENLLIEFSEGFPHFIQEYGYCSFEVSNGNTITHECVIKGAYGESGAIEAIGNRYYRDDYYNKIQGDNYRQVLNIMAESVGDWVSKKHIKSIYIGNPATLTNAINALLKRNIIIPKEGTKGVYRLKDKGFGLWIKMTWRKDEHDSESK
ncbi:MAG TPA: AAA family ATPase [Chitinophagaceae bacterium]|jgi:Cdc6-like AAA superfamily ATPase